MRCETHKYTITTQAMGSGKICRHRTNSAYSYCKGCSDRIGVCELCGVELNMKRCLKNQDHLYPANATQCGECKKTGNRKYEKKRVAAARALPARKAKLSHQRRVRYHTGKVVKAFITISSVMTPKAPSKPQAAPTSTKQDSVRVPSQTRSHASPTALSERDRERQELLKAVMQARRNDSKPKGTRYWENKYGDPKSL